MRGKHQQHQMRLQRRLKHDLAVEMKRGNPQGTWQRHQSQSGNPYYGKMMKMNRCPAMPWQPEGPWLDPLHLMRHLLRLAIAASEAVGWPSMVFTSAATSDSSATAIASATASGTAANTASGTAANT